MAAFSFQPNHIETSGTTLYVGYSDKDGAWYVKKLSEATSPAVLSHATHANNAGYSTYTAAWAARTLLTYGRYDEAF